MLTELNLGEPYLVLRKSTNHARATVASSGGRSFNYGSSPLSSAVLVRFRAVGGFVCRLKLITVSLCTVRPKITVRFEVLLFFFPR